MATHATFLDEVAEFLGQSAVPEAPGVEKHGEAPDTGGDELLLASHELLAETKELLASYEAPPENSLEEDASNTAKSSEEDSQQDVPRGKLAVEKRREIRNAQAAKRRLRHRQQVKEEKETLKL
ncbi:hypothetical protein V7S43_015150 [Phytophthora oleae]|uniref:BZIP domain-containing protein n=1 Tax=Phytophthora oleae TaxID=2107226 RepID=A0ABD3EZ66_9STRA